ncbi:MAG: hypothetical protein EOP92_00930 [Lysobacteraceae bacterium]|nr:MAG: hypothetical protein EOP92_00930 [Xanthomonadaceae bacterium]
MPPHRKYAFLMILLAWAITSIACAAPAPSAPTAYPAEQVRADFDRLYAQLKASHYDLFARRSRADYDARFREMRREIDRPLTALQVRLRFQRFVAFGNIAHARIDPPSAAWDAFREQGGKAFPLYLRVAGGKVYIADDYSGRDDIAQGDQVLSVDGEPAMRWLEHMRQYVSADNDYMAWAQMETQLPLLTWMALGEVTVFDVVLVEPSGAQQRVKLEARTRAQFEATEANKPARFELDWNAREARMLEGGVGYLRPGPFYDNRPQAATPWDPTAFGGFIDAAFGEFIADGASSVLIDLRDNPGGDNSFSDLMVAWFADQPFQFSPGFDIKVSEAAIESNRRRLDSIGGEQDSTSRQLAAAYAGKAAGSRVMFPIPRVSPRKDGGFRGPVYLLVNRHSYSNTVLVAAIVQDYRFGKVLGEETADLASTYGALEKFTLPLTGIEVSFPKARILRPSGDPQARGVVPDIAIATPLAAGSTDTVLEQALDVVRAMGPSPAPK